MNRLHRLLHLSCCLFLVSSCAEEQRGFLDPKKNDLVDVDRKLSRQDFRDMRDLGSLQLPPSGVVSQGPVVEANVTEPPVPELAEILAAPKPPKVAQSKLVSIAVTDDVPIKDLLIQLARIADVDIEVDSNIQGGIAFRANERPFNEVIERIADLAGLRYSVKNNVLRVERDTPYIQTYTLDMLNIDRSASSKLDIGSTSGGSSSGGSSSSGSSGGSSSGSSGSSGGSSGSSSANITADSKGEFWKQFEDTVKQILNYTAPSRVSGVQMAVQQAPAAAPADAANAPTAPAPASPSVMSSTPVSNSGGASFYSLNRQAGTLTVSGTQKQQESVRRFLDAIESNISSQVLIEAKIVEVVLNDNYQAGINWRDLGSNTVAFNGNFSNVVSNTSGISPATVTIFKDDIFGTTVDLSAAVDLLSEFGTTRALSSPRLNAMNNQQAILSFVEKLIYFKVEVTVTDAVPVSTNNPVPTPAKVEVTSDKMETPVGITLALQPSINRDTNEITLSVRPTLTKVTDMIDDPGFAISKAQAAAALPAGSPIIDTLDATKSQIPQIEERQLDSILKVRSGQVMVIGGLLEDQVINNDAGVPGASEVPYIGRLFKSVQKTNRKKELVILLRATVVSPQGSADKADKLLYEKFIQDPRPLKF